MTNSRFSVEQPRIKVKYAKLREKQIGYLGIRNKLVFTSVINRENKSSTSLTSSFPELVGAAMFDFR